MRSNPFRRFFFAPWGVLFAMVLSPSHLLAQDLKSAELVLEQLHRAASQADGSAYFALFSEDAIFLGTDASERWTIGEFKRYALPYFNVGRGWTYHKTERHINISADGGHASFDELLHNDSYGLCRGTGVLRLIKGEWKIEQYHLTIPVPNALARDLVELIRSSESPIPSSE